MAGSDATRWYLLWMLTFAGCTATASGVPSLDAHNITAPRFASVQPRSISVVVEDDRNPRVDDHGETVANVSRAVSDAMTQAGFTVVKTSPHRLLLMIQSATQGMGDLSKDACIEIHGRLLVEPVGTAEAAAQGCYEYRHALGLSLGGGATDAYGSAISYVLQQLDRELSTARPRG